MPLLDHFRPPISRQHSWESFHSNWATRLADLLNEEFPPEFLAEEQTKLPSRYEILITKDQAFVGVIELISQSNKDRAEEGKAFATKAASYLHQGVSLILVDVVTSRGGNLHNDTLDQFSMAPSARFPNSVDLYASAFQPQLRNEQPEVELWLKPLSLGAELPTLPLRLTGDLFVPVDLEASYSEACQRRRIAG